MGDAVGRDRADLLELDRFHALLEQRDAAAERHRRDAEVDLVQQSRPQVLLGDVRGAEGDALLAGDRLGRPARSRDPRSPCPSVSPHLSLAYLIRSRESRGYIGALARADSGRLIQSERVSPMPAPLKYVDPNRPRSSFNRAVASFSSTRLGRWISAKVVWRVDPYLLRATGGRVGLGLVLPTALLETRGAKTGSVRRNGVIYFHDGDRVTIIASKQGEATHPAWFHNLRAEPDVTFGGIPMRATVVSNEAERRRLWALADRVFAPYAAYRRDAARANRTIPIVQLTPREPNALA